MPLVHAAHPDGFGEPPHMASLYYGGTVFTLIAMISILLFIGMAVARRGILAMALDNIWLLCAGLALWIAAAPENGPWLIMNCLPVLAKFTGPWKLLLFFQLLAPLGAGVIVERILVLTRTPRYIEI